MLRCALVQIVREFIFLAHDLSDFGLLPTTQVLSFRTNLGNDLFVYRRVFSATISTAAKYSFDP